MCIRDRIRKGAGKTSPEKPEEDVDDIDAMSPKMDKAVTIGGVIAGIVALMIVAVILTVVLSDNSIKLPKDMSGDEIQTIDPRKTVVPNVLGMSSDEAEKALNEKSLGFEYDSNYVSVSYTHLTGTNKDTSMANTPKKRESAKIYPNDPCPCGSGKKYKQCCGRKA